MSNLPSLAFLILFFISGLALGTDTHSNLNAPFNAIDLFVGADNTAAKNTAEGSLLFSDGSAKESVTLGQDFGHYALGLILKGEWLGENYEKDFSKSRIVQIVLGTLPSASKAQAGQWGLITLMAPEVPEATTTFHFLREGKREISKPQAMISFRSPNDVGNRSDTERLQNTFFGESGSVTFTPIGSNEAVSVRVGERLIALKKQKIKLALEATLSTPFSGAVKKLSGTLIFPIYQPSGKAAEKDFQQRVLPSSDRPLPKPAQSPIPKAEEPVRNVTGKTD